MDYATTDDWLASAVVKRCQDYDTAHNLCSVYGIIFEYFSGTGEDVKK